MQLADRLHQTLFTRREGITDYELRHMYGRNMRPYINILRSEGFIIEEEDTAISGPQSVIITTKYRMVGYENHERV